MRLKIKGGKPMGQKTEREFKSIRCPEREEKALVMCEWDIVSTGGRIFRRTLKQIDCHNRRLTDFGGRDCNWGCERMIGKRERQEL
jgi:hypothetical protein